MPFRMLRGFVFVIWSCLVLIQSGWAQDLGQPSKPSASIQQQLDELKEGQERLRLELEEIRNLLRERTPRTNATTRPAVPAVDSVNVRGEPFRGTNAARVAIIEYSDFDCSYCGRYARDIFPRLNEDYIKPGKLRYFFRDLPEPNETNSWFKARAARCAGDQGKFWELHDLLFSAQLAAEKDVVSLAETLGLNMENFNACLSTERYLINIERSVAGAKRMGIFGTPAFLIGAMSDDGDFVKVRRVMVGAESYASIKGVLDELIASAAKN